MEVTYDNADSDFLGARWYIVLDTTRLFVLSVNRAAWWHFGHVLLDWELRLESWDFKTQATFRCCSDLKNKSVCSCSNQPQKSKELVGVERVCNSMNARLRGSTNPPNECLSDNSQAGVQENNHTNFQSKAANFSSIGVSQVWILVDFSSFHESREDGEVV